MPKKHPNDLLQPVKVKVSKPKVLARKRYLLGLMEDAPFHVTTCAGQDWPRINEEVRVNEDGTTSRTEVGGRVVELSESEVKQIIDTVAKTMVIMQRIPFTLSSDSPRYRPAYTDRPLAEFIYMLPVGEMMPTDWRSAPKENMLSEEPARA